MASKSANAILDSFHGDVGPSHDRKAPQCSALIQPSLQQCASLTGPHLNRIPSKELAQDGKSLGSTADGKLLKSRGLLHKTWDSGEYFISLKKQVKG